MKKKLQFKMTYQNYLMKLKNKIVIEYDEKVSVSHIVGNDEKKSPCAHPTSKKEP